MLQELIEALQYISLYTSRFLLNLITAKHLYVLDLHRSQLGMS